MIRHSWLLTSKSVKSLMSPNSQIILPNTKSITSSVSSSKQSKAESSASGSINNASNSLPTFEVYLAIN